MAETAEEIKARKERERDELYALDISGVEWHGAPGTEEHEERVEIAYLPGGAVAMRSSLDPDTVLRYTEAEWRGVAPGAGGGGVDPGAAGARADGPRRARPAGAPVRGAFRASRRGHFASGPDGSRSNSPSRAPSTHARPSASV